MVDMVRSEAAKRGWQTRRIKNVLNDMMVNAGLTAKARSNFLSEFTGLDFKSPKHNHYFDFGYPTSLNFKSFFEIYTRMGLAHGVVERTVEKTWETVPQLLQTPADDDETVLETTLRKRLRKLRFWQNMVELDRRSMVGAYAGLILRIADNKRFNEPVDGKVPGGLDGLVEVIPAWEGQITVSEFDSDERSPTYGLPKMYQFNEANIAGTHNKTRSFDVHPDRVIILSDSGTVHDRSALEPAYNAFLDCEKVSGAGGEGFWKNAKGTMILEVDKEAKIQEMAKAMNVEVSELFDAIGEQIKDVNTGLDQGFMAQGINVKRHDVSLPSPEYFFNAPLQIISAAMSIPIKILKGNETGERASTEDQNQWAKTNMARRANRIVPFLDDFLERLIEWGMLDDKGEWDIHWDSLMEDSPAEKMGFAKQMAEVNQSNPSQPPFTHDEIRERVGYEPLKASDLLDPDDDHADKLEEDDDD
ncbi:MAG: phage portal protein [Pseudomonadota bacterium]